MCETCRMMCDAVLVSNYRPSSGETPSDVKPMNIIGKGTQEIRIQIGDAYRVFFVERLEEAVYVLHAFQKKSQQTARRDISLGQQRYLHMVHYRKEQQGKPA